MTNTRFDRTLRKAEAIVESKDNYTSRGKLKSRQQKRVDRLINKITYLSQFESNNESIF